MAQTVLILGATGSAGRHAAHAFEVAGWTVRRFNRATDDLTQQAQGADVIVNAWNPPNYHNWAGILPDITRQVIDAARATGARIVLPGNVYNFGNAPAPWSHETPQVPCSRKGQIRKDIEAMYRDAGVPTLVLRAGDFIASDGPANVIGKLMLASAHKGKITALGDPDVLHAFAYLPDWARAVVALVELGDALPDYADICFPGHTFTANELKTELERTMGPMQLSHFPWWTMTLAAPFWELAREFKEMRYLFNHPHSLDSTAFETYLPKFQSTDFATVARAEIPQSDVQDAEWVTA